MASTAQAQVTHRPPHLQLVFTDDAFPRVEPHHRRELVEQTPEEAAAIQVLVGRVMAGAQYTLDGVDEHTHDISHPAPIRLVSEPNASFVLTKEERRSLQLLLLTTGIATFDSLEFILAEA